jgi:molecular chaperone HtpG
MERAPGRHSHREIVDALQLGQTSKPVLEINPRHDLVVRLSALGESDQALREDAAHLLLDEARVADGELPLDPRAFSARLGRILLRGIGGG